jgi:MFS superfamily sulfate permease-like transporter
MRPQMDERFATTWKADLAAGLVVFLVALPLCLGIALASGAPLASGLISGVIGGLVVALISGSQLMVSGPAAGLTAIVATALTTLGSWEAFLAAVVLAGVLQLGLGAVRAGIIGYFFPSSVIKGMLAAIGIILIMKQLPYALGQTAVPSAFSEGEDGVLFGALRSALAALTPAVLFISVASLALLAVWDKTRLKKLKVLPGPLAVVLFGTAVNEVLRATGSPLALNPDQLVTLPFSNGGPRELFSALSFPDWSVLSHKAVYTVAVTIALVASLETLLSLEATDKLDPYKREAPANRELLAQGVGNILAGLIGGLPLTGVIVRSSANIDAGGRTRWAAFSHGVFLLVAVAMIPALLNRIPLAALAAILLYTGYKLAHPRQLRTAWRIGLDHFIPFTVTIVAILATDLLIGIMVGLAAGIFFVLRANFQMAYHLQEENFHYSKSLRLVLAEETSFLNKASIVNTLNGIAPGSTVEIDGTRAQYIDYDVLEILHNFTETAKLKNITLTLVGIPPCISAPAAH